MASASMLLSLIIRVSLKYEYFFLICGTTHRASVSVKLQAGIP